MDILTLIGVVCALLAVFLGSVLKGAGIQALLSGAAFMIVVVGTFAAIFIHTPLQVFKHAMGMASWVIMPPKQSPQTIIDLIVAWSHTARKQGLLGLEAAIDKTDDPFLQKGLQLLVDGAEPDQLRKVLEVDLSTREHADQAGAKVFEGMGIYAPTLGIIGAVLGLMAVMQNLADPSKLGQGIAAAFTATVYGIGLANLLFLPVAAKLKSIVAQQSHVREMMIEGLISIALGENPRSIESKLQGFLHE
jgi:chemotaxis protein MotA